MERQVSNLRGAIIEKDKQITDLERSLDEHLEMLQQNTKRMTELEEGNGTMQQQVYSIVSQTRGFSLTGCVQSPGSPGNP